MPLSSRRPHPFAAFPLLLALGSACQSSGPDTAKRGEPEPYVPLPDDVQSIGYFLGLFDRSLAQWSGAKLVTSSSRDLNALKALEASMHERAKERQGELLEVLECGAPINRRIAAAALGFTKDPTVLGPLLATLTDRDPEVVQKALLGIGILAQPTTPVGEIVLHLLHSPDSYTRNNAAFALLSIAGAGNKTSELALGCRNALADDEPGVRAQCASALGVVADPEAPDSLEELLYDKQNLVALAASASLARIGREHPEQKGTVARALATALERVDSDRREHILGALRWMTNDNFGNDPAPWLEWAHRLP